MNGKKKCLLALATVLCGAMAWSQAEQDKAVLVQMDLAMPLAGHAAKDIWNFEELSKAPSVHTVPEGELKAFENDSIRPIMYDGAPSGGRETRVFAWLGFPAGATPQTPVPGIVLVHGGGGTAFRNWVKTWNERGYAAIAMDNCAHLPRMEGDDCRFAGRHQWSAPGAPWSGWAESDRPVDEQWVYHAVVSVVRANSLLRSFPQVDSNRIGVTGISWGGYLTCIAVAVDSRFRFAAPVFGCGFLGEASEFYAQMIRAGKEKAEKWLGLWDPAVYLDKATVPMLFCNGTNDSSYYTPSWYKTTLLPQGPVTRCYRVRMPHDHGAPGDPPEIHAFAESIVGKGAPLPRLSAFVAHGRELTVHVNAGSRISRATVFFTCDGGPWPRRFWQDAPAAYDQRRGTVTGIAPDNATIAYLGVYDDRNLLVTSQLVFFTGLK